MTLQERIKKYKGKKVDKSGISNATLTYQNNTDGKGLGKIYIDLRGEVFKSLHFQYTGNLFISRDFRFEDGYIVKQSPKYNYLSIYNILRKPFIGKLLFDYYGKVYGISSPKLYNFSMPYIIPSVVVPEDELTMDRIEHNVDDCEIILEANMERVTGQSIDTMNLYTKPYHVNMYYDKPRNEDNNNIIRYYQAGNYIKKGLPKNYRLAEGRNNCANCGFYLKGFCEKWKESIVNKYYCNAWIDKYKRNEVKNMLKMEKL